MSNMPLADFSIFLTQIIDKEEKRGGYALFAIASAMQHSHNGILNTGNNSVLFLIVAGHYRTLSEQPKKKEFR